MINILSFYCPPFIVVDMPVDKNGDGPVNFDDADRIIYEVWDATNSTVLSSNDEETMKNIAEILNRKIDSLIFTGDKIATGE